MEKNKLRNDPDSDSKSAPTVKKKNLVREYAESIIIAVVLALFIRTFVVQAFKIPIRINGRYPPGR